MNKQEFLEMDCSELETHKNWIEHLIHQKENESRVPVWELCEDGMMEGYGDNWEKVLDRASEKFLARKGRKPTELEISIRKVYVRESDLDEDWEIEWK